MDRQPPKQTVAFLVRSPQRLIERIIRPITPPGRKTLPLFLADLYPAEKKLSPAEKHAKIEHIKGRMGYDDSHRFFHAPQNDHLSDEEKLTSEYECTVVAVKWYSLLEFDNDLQVNDGISFQYRVDGRHDTPHPSIDDVISCSITDPRKFLSYLWEDYVEHIKSQQNSKTSWLFMDLVCPSLDDFDFKKQLLIIEHNNITKIFFQWLLNGTPSAITSLPKHLSSGNDSTPAINYINTFLKLDFAYFCLDQFSVELQFSDLMHLNETSECPGRLGEIAKALLSCNLKGSCSTTSSVN